MKQFYINPQIGKVKYSASTYDGIDTYKDGSPFWGITTAKNKKDFTKKVNELKKSGFTEVSQSDVKY